MHYIIVIIEMLKEHSTISSLKNTLKIYEDNNFALSYTEFILYY